MGLAWGLIFLGMVAGYGLWADIRRDVMPVQTIAAGEVVVPRSADGHYYLTLTINGTGALHGRYRGLGHGPEP
jgi:aspartyl protease family protein